MPIIISLHLTTNIVVMKFNLLLVAEVPQHSYCSDLNLLLYFKVAAPPLDSTCDGPVTYPGDTKILVKSSKERSGLTLNTTTRSGLTDKDLGN